MKRLLGLQDCRIGDYSGILHLIRSVIVNHEELTHKIVGCAMKVHSTLGNGFQEVIYQRALAIEYKQSNPKIKKVPNHGILKSLNPKILIQRG